MPKEMLVIQIYGAKRKHLIFLFPISVIFNLINSVFLIIVMLLKSILKPGALIGTIIDIPSVLFQAVWGGMAKAITGKRAVWASDFSTNQIIALDNGDKIQHPIYGKCKLLEYRSLNEDNLIIERRIPSYLPPQPNK